MIKLSLFLIRRDFGLGNIYMTPTRLQMHDMVGPYHIDRACFVVPLPKVIVLWQHMFIIIITKYVASPSLPGHHCSLHLPGVAPDPHNLPLHHNPRAPLI